MNWSLKYLLGNEDPKKPTARAIADANAFARNFVARKGLTAIGDNAHVGDTIPPFIDNATGKEMVGGNFKLPPNAIVDIRKIPSYVTAKDIQYDENNIPYFTNQDGDIQPIHPDIARSSRFNPNRGKSKEDLQQSLATNLFGNRFSNY